MAIEYEKLKNKNTKFGGTDSIEVPKGTTAERTGTELGQVRYNTDLGFLEQYNATGWAGIDAPPTVSNVTGVINENTDSTITVTGSNFKSGSSIVVQGAAVNGLDRTLATTFVNSSELTASTNAAAVNYVGGASFNIKVTNPSGLSAVLEPAGTVDRDPIWSTGAGNLATWSDQPGSQTVSVSASDPDGTGITYSVTSGSLPGNTNLDTNTGAISSSDVTNVNNSTTYTFDISATSNSQSVARTFNIIVNPFPDGTSSGRAATSSTAIRDLGSPSGLYWMNINGSGAVQVYIDMANQGGGWMWLMRGNGNDGQQYGSGEWTNSTSYSESNLQTTPANGGFSKHRGFYTFNNCNAIMVYGTGFSGASSGSTAFMPFTFNSSSTPNSLMFSTSQYMNANTSYSTWRSVFGQDRTGQPRFDRYGSNSNNAYGNTSRGNVGCGQPLMFGFNAHDNGNDVNSGLGTHPNYCGGNPGGFARGSWMGNGGTVRIYARN